VQAFFVQEAWTLEVLPPSGNGVTAPTTGTYPMSVPDSVSVTATPDSYWRFDHWEVDGTPTGGANPIVVGPAADGQTITVKAIFVQETWTLEVLTPEGSGTTAPTTGTHTVNVPDTASVLATPAANWKLDHWEVDGTPAGSVNPIVVGPGADGQTITVKAIFVRQTWTLDVLAPDGSGTTAPTTGSYAFNLPDTASVTATADADWRLDHWEVDGAPVDSANPITVGPGVDGQTITVKAVFGRKGDFDGDGDIDFWDLTDFINCYGLSEGDPGWEPNGPIGDFDDSRAVDFWDLTDFIAVYWT